MFFSIVLNTDALYQEAMDFFIKQWRSDLLARAPSSLVWAYLVTQEMYKLWKLWFSFAEWVFSYEWMFFSTSHSNDMIVIAIDSKKVSVDIEYIHPRHEGLLENSFIPDSSYSQRENFYLQRCAKECLVKYLDITMAEMQEMTITAFFPYHYFAIGERTLNSLMIIHYRWKEHPVHLDINNGRVIAFLRQDDYNYMTF